MTQKQKKRNEHGWLDEDKASVRATQNTHTCTNNNTYVCIQSKTTTETTWHAAQTRKKRAPAIVDYDA